MWVWKTLPRLPFFFRSTLLGVVAHTGGTCSWEPGAEGSAWAVQQVPGQTNYTARPCPLEPKKKKGAVGMGTLEAPSSSSLLSLVKFPSISWKPGKRPSPGPASLLRLREMSGCSYLLVSYLLVLDPWIDCGLRLDYFDRPFE